MIGQGNNQITRTTIVTAQKTMRTTPLSHTQSFATSTTSLVTAPSFSPSLSSNTTFLISRSRRCPLARRRNTRRCRPSPLIGAAVTTAKGHRSLGWMSSTTNTKLPTSNGSFSTNHFVLCWREGTYSCSHLFHRPSTTGLSPSILLRI